MDLERRRNKMKTVYDEATQKLIDFYENRKAEIYDSVLNELNTMEGSDRYMRMKNLIPHYNPLWDNPEHQAICKELERIYTFAVPKYLLTKEEYNNLTCAIRKDQTNPIYTYPKGFVVVSSYSSGE